MRFTNLRKMSWTSLTLALLLAMAFCSSEKDKIAPEENTGGPPAASQRLQQSPQTRPPGGEQRRQGAQKPPQERPHWGQQQQRRGGLERGGLVSLPKASMELIDLQLTKPTYKEVESYIPATGKVLADQNKVAKVGPIFSGRISKIYVNPGDWVSRGDSLVDIESLDVAEAKTAFYKAYAQVELGRIDYERQQRLFKEDIGSQKNLLTAEANYKIAQANLNAAEKNLHTLGFTEEECKLLAETHQINPFITLKAPLSGRIVRREATLGAMVDQNSDLFTIMDLSTVWVDADIFEKDLANIKVGQKTEIRVHAYPNEVFQGNISYIADVFNEQTRTVTVRTQVKNKDSKLKVGMFANIRILAPGGGRVLVVPVEAVLDDERERVVFVKEGDGFRRQVVQVGVQSGGVIEVIQGLRADDEIVVRGNFQLLSEYKRKELERTGVH